MLWLMIILLAVGIYLVSSMIYSLIGVKDYSFRNSSILRLRQRAFMLGIIGLLSLVGVLILFVIF